jgi:hypothetical protein
MAVKLDGAGPPRALPPSRFVFFPHPLKSLGHGLAFDVAIDMPYRFREDKLVGISLRLQCIGHAIVGDDPVALNRCIWRSPFGSLPPIAQFEAQTYELAAPVGPSTYFG